MELTMNCEAAENAAFCMSAVLKDVACIEESLGAFLQQYPIYEARKDELLQQCLMASFACALAAGLVSVGCRGESADDYTSRFRAAIELEEVTGVFGEAISRDDLVLIADYLESFNYVYSQRMKRKCPSGQELLSPLSNMAFLAVTRMFGDSALWSDASARGPILHDLVLPLLVKVFSRFSHSEAPMTRH